MAGKPDHLAENFETENTGGLLSGFLAEEEHLDRRSLWRLGSWGVASVAAVVVAVLANQSSIGWRRDQVAAADLARQAQQIQRVAKDSESEARRLASAIDTLNGDRDRLYSRLTVLEQGLDSVTGSIARQSGGAASLPAVPPQVATDAPVQNVAPPAVGVPATTAPATLAAVEPAPTPLMAPKSIMAPPDAAAAKLIEPTPTPNTAPATPAPEVVGSIPPVAEDAELETPETTSPGLAVQRTEFAVDLGGTNSLGGLRALWRNMVKSNTALAALHPVVAVKESGGRSGMQLRLVAGPLGDAAAAAKICAALIEARKVCETTVFDGQRLAVTADEPPATIRPVSVKPAAHRRGAAKPLANADPARKPDGPSLSSLFGRR